MLTKEDLAQVLRSSSVLHAISSVAWVTENAYRPFCSERCRILDLGEWASGNRYIPDDEEHSDVMSGQVNPEE